MPYTILDRALGLASDFHDSRREARNSILRRIIPEDYQPEDLKIPQVPQPEELKEAEAKPMKEEGPKTLHAPKYDRRMKFNTALERSKHEASKEEPAWLKGAAEKIAISEGFATRAVLKALEGVDPAKAVGLLGKYPRANLRMQGVSNPAIRREAVPHFQDMYSAMQEIAANPQGLSPEAGQRLFAKLQDAQARLAGITGKQASDFDSIGITGRETTVSTEDILPTTPPLPIEEPSWYDMPNRPVMQKSARAICDCVLQKSAALFEDDTFTQRHPGVLPSAIGLGGAALLGIPAALLGGRRAVKMVQKANTRNIADVQARFDAAKAAVLNARKAKANVGDTRRLWDDLKKLDVDLSAAKAHVPDTASAQSAGRAIGGAYGGLLGGGTGVLGGLALNNPQQYEY